MLIPSLLSEYTFLLSMHSLIFSNMTKLKQGVKGKLQGPGNAVCQGCIHPAVGSASREHGSALSSPVAPVPPPPALCPQQTELSMVPQAAAHGGADHSMAPARGACTDASLTGRASAGGDDSVGIIYC